MGIVSKADWAEFEKQINTLANYARHKGISIFIISAAPSSNERMFGNIKLSVDENDDEAIGHAVRLFVEQYPSEAGDLFIDFAEAFVEQKEK